MINGIKCGDIFQAFLISQSLFHRVLVKALYAKLMADVCLCTRKTVMCASEAMGSLEFTVRKKMKKHILKASLAT